MIEHMLRQCSRTTLVVAATTVLVVCGSIRAQTDPIWFEGCGRISTTPLICDVFVPDVPVYECDHFEMGNQADSQLDSGHVLVRGWLTINFYSFCMVGCALIFDYTTAPCICCQDSTGNVDCDGLNKTDISDLTALIDHLYITLTPLCCNAAANCDGSADGNVDISDLTALIDFLYISFTPTTACP